MAYVCLQHESCENSIHLKMQHQVRDLYSFPFSEKFIYRTNCYLEVMCLRSLSKQTDCNGARLRARVICFVGYLPWDCKSACAVILTRHPNGIRNDIEYD